MTDLKKGDRVRVTVEGEVKHAYGDGSVSFGTGLVESIVDVEHIVSIEKIRPPVEVFKPGDVVRDKDGWTYALGDKGWVVLDCPSPLIVGTQVESDTKFTSKHYEKVNLG